ncbi:UDP-glycosyltransferase 84B2-like [Lotus japonicus]|uniref:UDP-glycosyltransferase 84B2-like n=1 Tax=Lotus japonicus TaxID=34305 RepID=UPI0025874FF0|nr:UDP-glycosyltransferase 84B2-like [Lotus japonicus]
MLEEKGVNILMVSLAYQGHLNPMLKFAKCLISKGINVTIATTENGGPLLLKHATTTTSDASNNSKIKLEFFSDGLTIGFDRMATTEKMIKTIQEEGAKNLSTLITNLTKVQNQNFSCVIISPFVPWAVDVISEHGIPCAMLWIQASTLYSIYCRYFNNTDSFPCLDDPNEKVKLPGLPEFEVKYLPSFLLPSSSPYYRQVFVDIYQALGKVKWVLGTSFYEIEEEIVKSMDSLTPIYPIGPLVSPFILGEREISDVSVDMWNAEDSCMDWLNKKSPKTVIYISFGSLIVLSQKQMDNIAKALKNYNKDFLWVVKPPDGEARKKGGAGELSAEFLKETEGKGLAVKWCNQEKVLMHPAVGCFVSHCGWNSILETLVAGVPVVACPYWTDQPTNAMLVTNVFKNGVNVNYGKDGVASTEEIEKCIWDVMEGPSSGEIKKRVVEIKESARKTLQEGGSSNENINRFLNELIVGNQARV